DRGPLPAVVPAAAESPSGHAAVGRRRRIDRRGTEPRRTASRFGNAGERASGQSGHLKRWRPAPGKMPGTETNARRINRSMNVLDFQRIWGNPPAHLTERAAAQSHFNDLCELFGQPK